MNLHARRLFEMLIRVRDFRAAHRGPIAASEMATRVFDDLDQCIARVETRSEGHISRRGALRALASAKTLARASLRKRMKAIVVTSRGVGWKQGEIHPIFEMPTKRNDYDLVISATLFAEKIEPVAQLFTDRGMPKDVVQRLRNETDVLQKAIDAATKERLEIVGIRSGLAGALKEAFGLVRQLDGITLNLFADDDVAFGDWKAARRVDWWQKRNRKKSASGPERSAPNSSDATM